jgi:PAS domain S-box-containing protein
LDKPSIPAELLLDHIQDGVLVVRDSVVLYCNEEMARTLGSTAAAIRQAAPIDFVPPEDRQRVTDRARRRLAGEETPSNYETELLHSNGIDRIPVLVSVGVIHEGPWTGALVSTFKNLSDVRRAMSDLEDRRAQLERILEGLPDAYYRTDAEGKVLYCTPAAEHIFGLRPEQLIGRPLADFYATPEERVQVVRAIMDGNGQHVLVEARMRSADGSIRWASTRARAMFDANGRFKGVEGIGRDISRRIEMEQTLREALRQLDTKERAKTRFLAAASHDLRQPIQAIRLFLDALRRSALDDQQQDLAGHMSEAVDSLSGLLDALLDVSRLDAGIIELAPGAWSVEDIFTPLESEISPQALARGLRFKLWFPHTPLKVYTDRNLLLTVLRNLMINAFTCTKAGGVLACARRRGAEVLIQVWDTGIGIDDEHLERIFEEFYQIDNPERDRTKGLGLGLAIVRRVGELLGTKVSCRSRVGRGTVFTLRLPLYDPKLHDPISVDKPASIVTPLVSSLEGKRCMVLEDDEQLALAMNTWLHSVGAHTERYPNAETALSMGSLDTTDYFIVDFRLSGALNGIEFLDEAQRRLSRPIRAALITGDTSPEFVTMASSSVWPVLYKPVAPDRLVAALLSS